MSIHELQSEWNKLYREELVQLAKERNKAQPKWPIFLDHCFARVILDNAVGIDQPWASVVRAPAVKNMTADQLRRAIALGRRIASGEVNLQDLDDKSLIVRGKTRSGVGMKRKRVEDERQHHPEEGDVAETSNRTRRGEMADIWAAFRKDPRSKGSPLAEEDDLERLEKARRCIANDDSMTPFRKRVLSLLTQVPRGRWTSYKHLAEGVSKVASPENANIKSMSCARAVGSAMRSNPFAPVVPCHRVLASNGKIGGFGGHWGEEGKFVNEKRSLLRSEGVLFDVKGKVIGSPFTNFH